MKKNPLCIYFLSTCTLFFLQKNDPCRECDGVGEGEPGGMMLSTFFHSPRRRLCHSLVCRLFYNE